MDEDAIERTCNRQCSGIARRRVFTLASERVLEAAQRNHSMDASNPYQSPSSTVLPPEEFSAVDVLSTSGRIGRIRYLAFSMGVGVLTMIAAGIGGGLGAALQAETVTYVVLGLAYLFAFVLSIMLTIQRCHDFNQSGWLSLLYLVPFVSLIFVFLPGTQGPNRFGNQTPPNSTALVVFGLFLPVVAFVGLLASVSLPAYNEYIDNANMAKVNSHYEEGARFVANEMRKHNTAAALGRAELELPADAAGWIAALNPSDVKSPDGTHAYVPAGSETSDNGAIGVAVSGSVATHDLSVELRRPAFVDMEAASTAIRLNEI